MPRRRIDSFKYASAGLWLALKEGPNLRIHLLLAVLVLILGVNLSISIAEWLILVLTIGLVISLELANSAIEEVVDFFTQNLHPGAKRAKDIAAGSVLVASMTAVVIGLLIFLPRILNFLSQ